MRCQRIKALAPLEQPRKYFALSEEDDLWAVLVVLTILIALNDYAILDKPLNEGMIATGTQLIMEFVASQNNQS